MWNEPTKERLEKIPNLYETEDIPLKDKLIHLHLFIGGCDWYIVEHDGDTLFWGYAILNNDYQMAEWGFISFKELCEISLDGIEVDCVFEEHFPIRKAKEIEKICKGNGWKYIQESEVDIETLIRQAVMDSVVELPCSECGSDLRCEPDATESYCFNCGKVVSTNNPLIKVGLI